LISNTRRLSRKKPCARWSGIAYRRRRTIFTPGSSIRSAPHPISKRAIDILVGNKRKFDTTTNHDLFATYVGSHAAADDTDLNNVSHQLHSVIASANQYLTVAIADNRSQIQAINDATGDSETAGPKRLHRNLLSELAKAVTRATKLEARFVESTRELDAIRDSLNKSEERAKTRRADGVPNRHALDEFFRVAQIAAMEKGEPLSVLLIDIDHFKSFNDNFGHGVGDQVLSIDGERAAERVREYDLPARYGGKN